MCIVHGSFSVMGLYQHTCYFNRHILNKKNIWVFQGTQISTSQNQIFYFYILLKSSINNNIFQKAGSIFYNILALVGLHPTVVLSHMSITQIHVGSFLDISDSHAFHEQCSLFQEYKKRVGI